MVSLFRLALAPDRFLSSQDPLRSNGVKLSTKIKPWNSTEVQTGMSVYILLLLVTSTVHTDSPGDEQRLGNHEIQSQVATDS